jgi:hypothetical protein
MVFKKVDFFKKLGNYIGNSSWVVPAGKIIPVPERDVRRMLFMIIWVPVSDNVLQEMSLSRKYQAIHYRETIKTIIEHLLKLYYFRDSSWKSVWIVHLFKNTPFAVKFKHNNKYPDATFIYKNMWEFLDDTYAGVYRQIISGLFEMEDVDVQRITKKPNIETTKKLCSSYCEWVSQMISNPLNSGAVTLSQVRSEVEKLLKKYSY